jgi:glyoxylase-like metal-dependent hydrolase (beta-lactamase superfamily II)
MRETPNPEAPETPVPTVEVGALLPRLDRGEDVFLLDVRNAEEFETWKIEPRRPVDTLHLPYFDFIEDAEASIAKVPRGRDVVVLCAQGGSSEMVAGMLQDAGIPSANIKGGMIAYGAYLEAVRVPLEAAPAARYELWQVNRRGKACLSYVVVSNGEAVVVDPSRHVGWYEAFTAGRGARVVRVLDTHVHADHVSGGPALARAAAAPYFVAAGEGFELKQDVLPLADGETIRVGGADGVSLEVRALWTPGHTPGSTSFLVDGRYLLSGDTLFVASVGRPDLGGHVVEWGHALFDTLKRRLADLPGETRVLPAHYGGVAEISGAGVVWGRLEDLRLSVPEMQIGTAEAFVDAVRGAVKDPPKAYAEIIKVNLGAAASEETISEWELGKNQCAASAKKAAGA